MREKSPIDAFSKLKPGSHIHLMGICGTAMGSLAGILQEMGFEISGSDENVYPPMSTQLEKLGISIMPGYKKENLEPAPDFVVVGNVITKKMEETKALLESQIPFSSLPEILGAVFLKERENIVCCGTHGKTTTTSMATWALESLGLHPGYLIGGVPLNFDYSFSGRKSDWFAIEGDEYDTAFFDKVPKFSHYHPKNVILTSIEFDHIDIYDSLDEVVESFRTLLQKIPKEGLLVYNGDDQNIKNLLSSLDLPYWTLSYGLQDSHHSVLLEENMTEDGTEVLCRVGDREFEFFGMWHGTYNSLNFLSLLTLMDFKGLDLDKVIESAETFKGVARRQQQLVNQEDLKVFEDFAHHPSAVALTVQSFRKRFPDKNLIAVFEPRSATSRKAVFQKDYIKSFKGADLSVVAPVAKKSEADVFSSELLVSEIEKIGQKAVCPEKTQDIPSLITGALTGNDVVVFMSNGGFEGVHKTFASQYE